MLRTSEDIEVHSASSGLVSWQPSNKSAGLTESVRATRLWKCWDLNSLPKDICCALDKVGWNNLKKLASFEGSLVQIVICRGVLIYMFDNQCITMVFYCKHGKLSLNLPYILILLCVVLQWLTLKLRFCPPISISPVLFYPHLKR